MEVPAVERGDAGGPRPFAHPGRGAIFPPRHTRTTEWAEHHIPHPHARTPALSQHALVTGGAGFIGSHLVDRLLAEGWRVTVLDSFDPFYDPAIKRANVAPHLANDRFTLVEADLRDADALEARLTDRYDVVFHLGARAGVRPSIAQPLVYQDVNVRGTQLLLELCRARGIGRFVFAKMDTRSLVARRVLMKFSAAL